MNNYTLLIGRIANDFNLITDDNGKQKSILTLSVTKPFKNPETNPFVPSSSYLIKKITV